MGRLYNDAPLREITLRKYEKPQNLEERELIKKVCLGLGLLQPGDSRDSIVDILYVFLKERRSLKSKEVEILVKEERKKKGLNLNGLTPSNIRRQLFRLRQMFLIEKKGNEYRINENLSLEEIFNEKIEKYYIKEIIERIKEYLREVDKRFIKNRF